MYCNAELTVRTYINIYGWEGLNDRWPIWIEVTGEPTKTIYKYFCMGFWETGCIVSECDTNDI